MRFKTIARIALILVIIGLQGIITVKADVTIDPANNHRILIGPNKAVDWVQVDCIDHISNSHVIINDYCDHSPIQSITYDPLEDCYFIKKSHSRWVFFMGRPEDMLLRLLDHDKNGDN